MISEGTLFRPTEGERGFSTAVTFVPGGAALFLDRRVLVSAKNRDRGKGISDMDFCVVASKGVPIVFQRNLERGVKHEGEIDYYQEEVGAIISSINTTTKRRVFIGNEYIITMIGINRNRISARIQSTQPLQIETVRFPTERLPLLRQARS